MKLTIKQYRNSFIERLANVLDTVESENIFYLALEHYLNLKRIDVALDPERPFSNSQFEQFESVLRELVNEVPIQYILGSTHFCGLEFEVDSNVLIPRPETEELVDWIASDYEFRGKVNLLDIGTGSGCIAISLAHRLPQSDVTAVDISAQALQLAKRNAARNNVDIDFIETNILECSVLDRQYDIIVSNPPYVRNLEKIEIKKNVLDYEPHLALFVEDDDALIFYRKIAALACEFLTNDGRLYFEINQYLGAETEDMLRAMGFSNVEMRQDIYGNDRMIKAWRQ